MIRFNGDNKHISGIKKQLKELLKQLYLDHKKKIESLEYTFVNDETLLQINRESLNHDYYTDIITFDYSTENIIEGDIYISIDRVKENAETYNEKFHVELLRVIIHGSLHLVGYKDKSKTEKTKMTKMENHYINKYLKMFHVEQ
jgi:probable rRNA maturation factor